MIIEISVAVTAFAFVILVIYLIVMIKTLTITLGQVNLTLSEFRKVAQEANLATYDVKRKLETLNPFFQSVENVGDILESETQALKERNLSSSIKVEQEDLNVSDIAVVANLGIRLWNKFNKRRKS